MERIARAISANLGAKIVAVVFAVVLWFHVTAQQQENQSPHREKDKRPHWGFFIALWHCRLFHEALSSMFLFLNVLVCRNKIRKVRVERYKSKERNNAVGDGIAIGHEIHNAEQQIIAEEGLAVFAPGDQILHRNLVVIVIEQQKFAI